MSLGRYALLEAIKKKSRYIRFRRFIQDEFWLKQLIEREIYPIDYHVKEPGSLLVRNGSPVELPRSQAFLLDEWRHLEAIITILEAKFEQVDDRLIASLNGLRFWIQTSEDLCVLDEIFVACLYQFACPTPDLYVVWDIGMNVGIASIYFASLPFVHAVVGHELFADTYEQALRNIALNPTLAHKISANPTGIAAKDDSIMLEYCRELRASAGFNGLPKEKSKFTTRAEQVTTRDASVVLDEILKISQIRSCC